MCMHTTCHRRSAGHWPWLWRSFIWCSLAWMLLTLMSVGGLLSVEEEGVNREQHVVKPQKRFQKKSYVTYISERSPIDPHFYLREDLDISAAQIRTSFLLWCAWYDLTRASGWGANNVIICMHAACDLHLTLSTHAYRVRSVLIQVCILQLL